MDKFCTRCGKKLEEDGFCMNCMNFDRNDGSDTEQQETKDTLTYSTPTKESLVKDEPQKIYRTGQTFKRTEGRGVVAAIAVIIVISFVGLLLINFVNGLSTDFFNSEYQNENIQEISEEDDSVNYVEQDVDTEIEDDTEYSEETKKYKVDYDKIMFAGEPCNAYNHFPCKKDDLIPLVNDYFTGNKIETEFETSMDNYYEMDGEEKITYYETYSDWIFNDDMGIYTITSDSVTDHILYINIVRKDIEDVIPLLRESLLIIDPNIPESDLDEMETVVREKAEDVSGLFGDYYIMGAYVESGFSKYYTYYIFDMDEE